MGESEREKGRNRKRDLHQLFYLLYGHNDQDKVRPGGKNDLGLPFGVWELDT